MKAWVYLDNDIEPPIISRTLHNDIQEKNLIFCSLVVLISAVGGIEIRINRWLASNTGGHVECIGPVRSSWVLKQREEAIKNKSRKIIGFIRRNNYPQPIVELGRLLIKFQTRTASVVGSVIAKTPELVLLDIMPKVKLPVVMIVSFFWFVSNVNYKSERRSVFKFRIVLIQCKLTIVCSVFAGGLVQLVT